jgi:hypothetical protein
MAAPCPGPAARRPSRRAGASTTPRQQAPAPAPAARGAPRCARRSTERAVPPLRTPARWRRPPPGQRTWPRESAWEVLPPPGRGMWRGGAAASRGLGLDAARRARACVGTRTLPDGRRRHAAGAGSAPASARHAARSARAWRLRGPAPQGGGPGRRGPTPGRRTHCIPGGVTARPAPHARGSPAPFRAPAAESRDLRPRGRTALPGRGANRCAPRALRGELLRGRRAARRRPPPRRQRRAGAVRAAPRRAAPRPAAPCAPPRPAPRPRPARTMLARCLARRAPLAGGARGCCGRGAAWAPRRGARALAVAAAAAAAAAPGLRGPQLPLPRRSLLRGFLLAAPTAGARPGPRRTRGAHPPAGHAPQRRGSRGASHPHLRGRLPRSLGLRRRPRGRCSAHEGPTQPPPPRATRRLHPSATPSLPRPGLLPGPGPLAPAGASAAAAAAAHGAARMASTAGSGDSPTGAIVVYVTVPDQATGGRWAGNGRLAAAPTSRPGHSRARRPARGAARGGRGADGRGRGMVAPAGAARPPTCPAPNSLTPHHPPPQPQPPAPSRQAL